MADGQTGMGPVTVLRVDIGYSAISSILYLNIVLSRLKGSHLENMVMVKVSISWYWSELFVFYSIDHQTSAQKAVGSILN